MILNFPMLAEHDVLQNPSREQYHITHHLGASIMLARSVLITEANREKWLRLVRAPKELEPDRMELQSFTLSELHFGHIICHIENGKNFVVTFTTWPSIQPETRQRLRPRITATHTMEITNLGGWTLVR